MVHSPWLVTFGILEQRGAASFKGKEPRGQCTRHRGGLW